MKRFIDELNALAWTLAGTGLVIITLTGAVRRSAIIITLIALGINLATIFLSKDDQ